MPLVSSVSAREPASIHTPTVEVCAKGECSVATCGIRVSKTFLDGCRGQLASVDGAHGQSIAKSCGLSLADGRGRGKASCQGSGGRKTSTVSQTSGEVQS